MFKFKTENKDHITHGSEIHHESKKVGTVIISSLSEAICDGLGVINISAASENLSIKGSELKIK